jgi:hypothetical protein
MASKPKGQQIVSGAARAAQATAVNKASVGPSKSRAAAQAADMRAAKAKADAAAKTKTTTSAKNKKKTPVKTKPAVPKTAPVDPNFQPGQTIKLATSNLFILNEPPQNTEIIADTIIQDIGGQEIVNLSRHDLLNGQATNYSIIANLAETAQTFDPNNLIALQGTDAKYFSAFLFSLNNYVPEVGSAVDISGNFTGKTVYVDPQTGQVVIDTINLASNQQIEIEFISYETMNDGTI